MDDRHDQGPHSRAPGHRLPAGIDEQGVPDLRPARESLIDRQIREAVAEGKFDDLPYQGQPLPREDDALAGEWALAFHILRNNGIAPPWIEADKDVRRLLERRDTLIGRAATGPVPPSPLARQHDRETLSTLVDEINQAITRLNTEAPTDRQHRRLLSVEEELARYEASCRR